MAQAVDCHGLSQGLPELTAKVCVILVQHSSAVGQERAVYAVLMLSNSVVVEKFFYSADI